MSKEANHYISNSLNHRHSGPIGKICDELYANRYSVLKPTIDIWASTLKTQSVALEYNLNWSKSVFTYDPNLVPSSTASKGYSNVVNARQAVDQAVLLTKASKKRQTQNKATVNA